MTTQKEKRAIEVSSIEVSSIKVSSIERGRRLSRDSTQEGVFFQGKCLFVCLNVTEFRRTELDRK